MSSESSLQTKTTSNQNSFDCSFCGAPNQVSLKALEKVRLRCSTCKLPLHNKGHARFQHLDPAVYRHPLEVEAQQALQNMPGLQALLQKLTPLAEQSYSEAFFAANSLRINGKQYPDLYAKLVASCQTLGLKRIPHLYVSHVDLFGMMGMHAYTGGVEHPFIVLSASLLELDEQEVVIALAHELGYIHCNQLTHKIAADFLPLLLNKTFKKTPLENLADTISLPMQQALISWRLKANLSADRSAMLVIQDEARVMSYLMKQAGGLLDAKSSLEAFITQAQGLNVQLVYSWIEKYWQQLLFNQATLSFPVWRAAELSSWSREKQKGYGYEEIFKIFGT